MEKEDMHTKQQSEDSVCKSVPHQPKSKTRKVATTKKRACKGNSSIDIISIMLIILNIIFGIAAIACWFTGKSAFGTLFSIVSIAIFAGYKYYEKEKGKADNACKKIILYAGVIMMMLNAICGVYSALPRIFVWEEKPIYDFSKAIDEDFDIFFLKEQKQSELAENIEQSLLLIKPLEKHNKDYLNKLIGYADIAPLAKKCEDIMLFMIHKEYSGLSDAEIREFLQEYENGISDMYCTKIPNAVIEAIYDCRFSMDDECITAENRNCIFEDALSSANFKFREKYKEDYKIAARYVWATLYASVGLDTFTEAEIDKVIRVYRNMLESKEFDEYKENINLITSALELIKADSSFIDSEIVEMMANNN